MEYVGPALEWDEIWWRGSRDAGVFTAWYLKDARLAAALTVGRSADLEAARRLLTQGVDLTGKRPVFEDPGGDLAALESARAEPHGSLLGTIAQYAGAPKQFVKGRFARRGTELPGSGEGRVVQVDGDKVAAYREKDGELHAVSAVCTHLRCVVEWNGADRTWDCPCHGSRFDYDGRVIKGPAKTDLEQKPVAEPASR